MLVMNIGDQVYRLVNDIKTDNNKMIWMNWFFKNNKQDRKVWMITPFKTIGAQQRYTAHLTAIRDFMNNAHTLMD